MAFFLLFAGSLAAAEQTFLIRFGVGGGDAAGRDWSGQIEVSGGRLVELRGWQFDEGDEIVPPRSWKARTKVETYWHAPWERSLLGTKRREKLSQRGLIVTVDGVGARVAIETPQGAFSFSAAEVNFARAKRGGSVEVSRVPRPRRLTDPERAEDFPAAIEVDGEEWLAWQAYENGGERLWVRRGDRQPEAIAPPGGDLFGVQLAADGSGAVWAVWSARQGDNFDLYARRWSAGVWSATERLTSAPASDIFHRLAAGPNGRLYLVWQSFRRGDSEIFLKLFDGEKWGDDLQVSDDPENDWEPSVAVSPEGRVAIAWDGYSKGDYDIFLRFFADGKFSDAVRITESQCFEARVDVRYGPSGRLWLTWEEGDPEWGKDYVSGIENKGIGLLMRRQVRVAAWENGRLRQLPAEIAEALPEERRQIFLAPRLAFDPGGAPWVLFRYRANAPQRPQPAYRGMWRLGATSFQDGRWTPLVRFPDGYGRIDSPTAAYTGADGEIRVRWVGDGRTFPTAFPAEQDLYGAMLEASAAGSAPSRLVDFRHPTESFPRVHPAEAEDVSRLRAYRAEVGGETLRIVRGDMHRHTDLSWDGNRDGSLFDSYRYALDAARMDYLGVADHGAGANVEYQWRLIQKAVDLFTAPGRFTPLYGYERSRSYPSGHRNVMFDRRGVRVFPVSAEERARNAEVGVGLLYRHLRAERGIVMSHTSATGAGTDWRDNDPEVEPLVEIYQGYRTSYEHAGAPRSSARVSRPAGLVWKAWEKGLRLGVQASSDHVSTHASYAMIYVDELSRKAILEGIRARRAYAATDNILLDFRINSHLMGEEFESSEPPRIEAVIHGTGAIAKVEVIRNNEYIHTQPGEGEEMRFTYVDNAAPEGLNYYYVRVEQENGELAWASPVWVTRGSH